MMNTMKPINIMKPIYIIFLMSLCLPQSWQHKNHLDTDKKISHLDIIKHLQEEENISQRGDSKTETISIEDHKKPTLKLYQLDTVEFYRHLNVSIYGGRPFNLSGGNGTFDDADDLMCPSGQSSLIYLLTIVLYSIVCIVGLFGNTLVIYVVLRFSKMQTVTNIYILNLAIADESFLIGIPFLLYTMHTGRWLFGEYACKAYMVSTSITQFTSSIFLLIMSADRYIAVCHPISSPRFRTPMVSKMVSGIAWLTSALLMLPVILFANVVSIEEHTSCNIKWPETEDTQSGITFILYSLALGFATPLTFILVFYCLVIRKLHTVGPKNKSKEKKRSHRKVTRLVLTVITVYVLCWLPYWISQVALITSSLHCMSRLEITIFLLVSCLGYSNSAMNPVLYAFLSDNFKKSFMKACTCAARKDINAQLQMENSIFPRFNKSKATDKMLPFNKTKQKRSILGKSPRSKMTGATTTATTTITAGAATTTICHNPKDNNHAAEVSEKNLQNHFLTLPNALGPSSSSYGSVNSNQQLLAPGNTSIATDNSIMENSSDCSGFLEKPNVLHTDL